MFSLSVYHRWAFKLLWCLCYWESCCNEHMHAFIFFLFSYLPSFPPSHPYLPCLPPSFIPSFLSFSLFLSFSFFLFFSFLSSFLFPFLSFSLLLFFFFLPPSFLPLLLPSLSLLLSAQLDSGGTVLLHCELHLTVSNDSPSLASHKHPPPGPVNFSTFC